jgi:hypothetical protein
MSRRGAILQDYGGNFNPMPLESQLTAAQLGQRQQEFDAQQKQQKQQKSDKEAYDLISDLKIDHIGDNTIDVMTDKQLQGLQDELMDMHLKGATTDQLRLTAQRKLPEISNGHTLAKNKLKEINEGVSQLGKSYKNADLVKAKELALKPMIQDVVEFDDKGNPIKYKDVATVPNRNYTDILFDDNTLGQWYKPSGEFMSGIKSLPLTPIQGGSVRRDARGKLIDQTYTGHASIFDQPVVDKETGKMLGQELKYEDVAIGVNEDGTPKTVRAMPVEQFNLAFPTEDAKLDFRIKFNDEMRKQGVDPSKIDPRAKDVLQRQYLYDLFKNTGIHGSSFLPKDIEKQPLPPRVTNNIRVGDKNVTINDVSSKIDQLMNDPNAAINQNGKRIGTVMNKLPLDAFNVVVDLVNSKRPADSQIDPNEMFLANVDGERRVYQIAGTNNDGKQLFMIDDKYLLGVLPRTTVNTKVNTDTKRKEKVLKEGDVKVAEPQSSNKWNKYKRN